MPWNVLSSIFNLMPKADGFNSIHFPYNKKWKTWEAYKIYKCRNDTENKSEHDGQRTLGVSKHLRLSTSMQKETTVQPILPWAAKIFFFFLSENRCVCSLCILSLQSLRGSDRKIGSAKSSFPRRVIKALPSLSQTDCGGKSAPPPLPLPLRVQAPLVTSPRSTEDRIDCSGSSSKSNIPGLVLSERLV